MKKDNLKNGEIKQKINTVKSKELGEFYCIDPYSANYALKEIIDDRMYEKQFFKFKENDTIIDVGANIGIFSLYIANKLNGNLKLYSLEPIPQNYELLSKNLANYFPQLKAASFNIGLSDFESPAEIEFSYYPNNSTIATMDKSIIEKTFLSSTSVETTVALLKAIKSKINPITYYLNSFLLSLKPISGFLNKLYLENILIEEKVICKMSNLSKFIEDNNITQIDFLKIDTEGAELKIFNGIKPVDWQKIKQIAIEVHDSEYIIPITSKLKEYSFINIELEKDDLLMTEMIYASK